MTNAEKYLKDGVDEVAFAGELADLFLSKMGEKYPYAVDTFIDYFHDLAEPQLTEDERVILKFLENFDYIGRDKEGLYYKLQDENNKEKTAVIYNLTTNLFQFIKEGEEYEIAELLGGE